MALPGFRDFYPDDCAFRNAIFAKWRDVAQRYGFIEYDGPPLEPLDLFTKKSGDEIVTQLYHFKDKGDRDVVLRPDDGSPERRYPLQKFTRPFVWRVGQVPFPSLTPKLQIAMKDRLQMIFILT